MDKAWLAYDRVWKNFNNSSFFWPFNAATRGQGAGLGEKGAEKNVKGEEVAILQAGTWD